MAERKFIEESKTGLKARGANMKTLVAGPYDQGVLNRLWGFFKRAQANNKRGKNRVGIGRP